MSPSLIAEMAPKSPVVSIISDRLDDPGYVVESHLQEFFSYIKRNDCSLPYTMNQFFSDYMNFTVVEYITKMRKLYGPDCHFTLNMTGVVDGLSKLAFLSVVRDLQVTEATLDKAIPVLTWTQPDDKKDGPKPTLEFRAHGIMKKVEDGNKSVYVFRETVIRDFLMAKFLKDECLRKAAAGKEGYNMISTSMRYAMRKLPATADVWRMTFGLMSSTKITKDCQKSVLQELIEEAKLNPSLTPFEITNLCVEAIYESQNAGELTELLDDFTLNQTIRYSNEYLKPARLPYAVSAVGYMVRATGNVYGVHMAQFGLGPKNIGMLADPVNDVSDNNLQVLNISSNPLGGSGVKGLLRFLVKATLLTHLDLGSCELGNVGVALLSEFFMCMPLRYLRVSSNNIGDAGVKRMVRNLKYVPTLEWLDLSGNKITDKGAEKLGETLRFLPNLRSLDVQKNNIGDDGAESISQALAKLNQVTQLMLGDNKIGQKGAKKLSAHVWKTKSLRYVNLSLNNIPAEGIMGLRKAAQDHGDLRITVADQSQSAADVSLSAKSEGEFTLEPGLNDNLRPKRSDSGLSTMSSINLVEGRNMDFERGRPLRRSWSGRASFRRSWHEMSDSFRREVK